MDSNPEEVMGCFLGMAVGDAMGRAVKGLKPEAIRQIFGTIEDYKDVRNIIGKGTKNYRMQGLYGAPTQCKIRKQSRRLRKPSTNSRIEASEQTLE